MAANDVSRPYGRREPPPGGRDVLEAYGVYGHAQRRRDGEDDDDDGFLQPKPYYHAVVTFNATNNTSSNALRASGEVAVEDADARSEGCAKGFGCCGEGSRCEPSATPHGAGANSWQRPAILLLLLVLVVVVFVFVASLMLYFNCKSGPHFRYYYNLQGLLF